MYEKLDGRCMICGEQERLVIDHNHQNGDLRGLLCYAHNAGLGMFQDRPDLLRKAADYLELTGPAYPGPEAVDARMAPIHHKAVAQDLFNNPTYRSDRQRALELMRCLGISESAAQSRISRLRQQADARKKMVQNP